jgi:hypothetical protein
MAFLVVDEVPALKGHSFSPYIKPAQKHRVRGHNSQTSLKGTAFSRRVQAALEGHSFSPYIKDPKNKVALQTEENTIER